MRRAAGPACGFLAVLITVTLTYAATAPGDAAADGILAEPASLLRASPPSRYPPSWATRCAANPALCPLCSPLYLAWYLRPRPRRLTEFQAQASCSLACAARRLTSRTQAKALWTPTIVTLLSRSRLNQRHLLTFDPPRSTTESSLRAIATVDTPATDPAVSSGATCDKCQWR
jgi:hypothetical protein